HTSCYRDWSSDVCSSDLANLVNVTLPPVIGGASLSQSVNLDTALPRITGRELTVRLELCDCDVCEGLPGSGNCKTFDLPVLLPEIGRASCREEGDVWRVA